MDQEEPLEIYQPKWKYCAELSSYGAAVCTEAEAKRVQNLRDHPLYYFLGYTQFACQLEPGILYYKVILSLYFFFTFKWLQLMWFFLIQVRSSAPIENIKIQISAGPHKHISNDRQIMAVIREIKVLYRFLVSFLIRTPSLDYY